MLLVGAVIYLPHTCVLSQDFDRKTQKYFGDTNVLDTCGSEENLKKKILKIFRKPFLNLFSHLFAKPRY